MLAAGQHLRLSGNGQAKGSDTDQAPRQRGDRRVEGRGTFHAILLGRDEEGKRLNTRRSTRSDLTKTFFGVFQRTRGQPPGRTRPAPIARLVLRDRGKVTV